MGADMELELLPVDKRRSQVLDGDSAVILLAMARIIATPGWDQMEPDERHANFDTLAFNAHELLAAIDENDDESRGKVTMPINR